MMRSVPKEPFFTFISEVNPKRINLVDFHNELCVDEFHIDERD